MLTDHVLDPDHTISMTMLNQFQPENDREQTLLDFLKVLLANRIQLQALLFDNTVKLDHLVCTRKTVPPRKAST